MREKKLISVLVPVDIYEKIIASAADAEYGRSPYLRQLLKKYFRYLETHPESREELAVVSWRKRNQ